MLTGLTIVLLVILLLLPLAVIFTEALSRGLGAVGDALTEPDSIGVHPTDAAGGCGQRAVEHDLRRGRRLVHRPFSVPRP